MIVSEIFYSVQAEGMLAGLPAAFLLTNDGPARQTWCGVKEKKWSPDPDTMFGSLLSKARTFWCDHAVISGLEPLAMEGLDELTAGLKRFDHHVTVETTGSVFSEVPCDLLSININLHNPAVAPKKVKGAAAPQKYELEVLRQLTGHYNYQLKFAVSDRSEMEEIRNTAMEIGADRNRVLLSPAAASGKALNEQATWIIEASRFFGYRYAPRLGSPAEPPKKPAGEKPAGA
jgi:organic radical activating enzyme